jgi:hypothetical protein
VHHSQSVTGLSGYFQHFVHVNIPDLNITVQATFWRNDPHFSRVSFIKWNYRGKGYCSEFWQYFFGGTAV